MYVHAFVHTDFFNVAYTLLQVNICLTVVTVHSNVSMTHADLSGSMRLILCYAILYLLNPRML